MSTMSIQALSEKIGLMEHHEENEDKYLRGCSHECRVHPRNRYVQEHNLSQAEVRERLAVIGETLDGAPA